jgi:hypothetical protein
MARLHRSAVFYVAMIVMPFALGAQQGAERAVIDSVLNEMSAVASLEELASAARCRSIDGAAKRLCEGLLAARRAEFTSSSDDAMRADFLLRQVVQDRPSWSVGWYGLGMARLQLARAGVLAKEGPLHPIGLSNEGGAGYALVKALELDSTFVAAGEALAMAPFPREGASRMVERAAMLRRIRHHLHLSPMARVRAGIVEREAGSDTVAIEMFREALASGADTGLVHLELARVMYRAQRPVEGREWLIDGAGLASSSLSSARYREELAWVAAPSELAAWDLLPQADRSAWLAAFWAGRDVRDGRGSGERLIEHYTRYEEAMKEFTILIPQKGRQRVMSVSRAGDLMINMSAPGIESPDVRDATINASSEFDMSLGTGSPFRHFGINQPVLDDRGVVWIRHGEPTERRYTVGGTAKEGWRYVRTPEPDLILFFGEADFDGASGATVLIPSVAGADGQQLNQLCGAGQGMCDDLQRFSQPAGTTRGMRTQIRRSSASPSDLAQAREEGRAQITRSVTTDDNRLTFAKPVTPTVQIYGLDRAAGGASRLVVAFAIPGDQITGTQPPAAGGRTVYPVRIRLMATTPGNARRFDLDTVRTFATAAPLRAGQFLTAMVELPVPPGTYQASLVISQSDEQGALARLDAVAAPNRSGGLDLSSIVLGREGSGITWQSGSTAVALNPLNAYPPGGSAELYYQLSGLKPGTSYVTTFEFLEATDQDGKPALSLQFSAEAGSSAEEIQRSVGLQNLKPGHYRLRVTIAGGGEQASEMAWLAIIKD